MFLKACANKHKCKSNIKCLLKFTYCIQ